MFYICGEPSRDRQMAILGTIAAMALTAALAWAVFTYMHGQSAQADARTHVEPRRDPPAAKTEHAAAGLVTVRRVGQSIQEDVREATPEEVDECREDSMVEPDQVLDGVSLDVLSRLLSGALPQSVSDPLRAWLREEGYTLEAQAADIALYCTGAVTAKQAPESIIHPQGDVRGEGGILPAAGRVRPSEGAVKALPDCFVPRR